MIISTLRRIVGAISVEEKDGIVTISGLPANVIQRDMVKVWGTTRVPNNLFTEISGSKVKFHSFFVYEFYISLTIIAQNSKAYVSRGTINKLIDLLHENTWLGREPNPDILNWRQKRRLELDPLEHQAEFVNKYAENVSRMGLRGYYLASPPGSGKTFTGLLLAKLLEMDAVIIVCPKNAIREVWLKNITEYVKGKKTVWLSDTTENPPRKADYYICHYEALKTLLDNVRIFKGRRVMIDLDESHNFNESGSLRSERFVELVEETEAEHVLWASGTPFKAMASEMITFLRSCDPLFTKDVEKRFKGIFGVSVERANDILAHRIGMVTYNVEKGRIREGEPIVEELYLQVPDAKRFTLKEVAKDMAEYINGRKEYYFKEYPRFKTEYDRAIEIFERTLDEDQWPAFDEYRKQVTVLQNANDYRPLGDIMKATNYYEKHVIDPVLPPDTRKAFRRAKGVLKYTELVIRGEALGNVLSKRRVACSEALVDVIDFDGITETAEKKVLVFTNYVEVVKRTMTKLAGKHQPMAVFADTNKDIERIIGRFDNDKKANPLVATLKSLSTAVPVTSANTVVFVDSPFRDYQRDQAISRIDRLGQDTQTYVIDIFLDTGDEPNVSTRSRDILQWSKEQVDRLMGQTTDVSLEEYDDTKELYLIDRYDGLSNAVPSLEW